MASTHILSISLYLLVIILPELSHGCFPMENVFYRNALWYQDIREPWRRFYDIGRYNDTIMTVEKKSPKSTKTIQVTCLESYSDHRYLAEFNDEGKSIKFGCLKFTSLSRQVVRRAKTKLHRNLKKVNCETDVYKEEPELMIAYNKMAHEPCPLTGGYQLLLHEGGMVKGHCLDSVKTYNPRMEFSCNGDHVMADFGQDCAPVVSTQDKNQYQELFAYLQCVGSWDEPGKGVKAVLLQKKSDPFSFWCMHYKPANNNSNGEILTIYLSVKGHCSSNAFSDDSQDVLHTSSLIGSMARYVQMSDNRCFEASYVEKCSRTEATCFETDQCPLDCHRCTKKVNTRKCSLTDSIGHWTTIDSHQGLTVDVKNHGFKVTEYGIFSCYGSENSATQEGVFPVVRNNPLSTCLPFYACAKVYSPAPGVLNFFLRAAKRDRYTGRPLSCTEYPDGLAHIIPIGKEKTITLVNRENLLKVPCKINRDMLFPSQLKDCRLSLKKCTDNCDTLYADFDLASCSNDTRFDIEHEHVCHSIIQLMDGIQALITSSVLNERYLCWIYSSHRMFVTILEHCNPDGAKRIFSDEQAHLRYDPFNAISLPHADDIPDRIRSGCQSNYCPLQSFVIVIVIATSALLFLTSTKL